MEKPKLDVVDFMIRFLQDHEKRLNDLVVRHEILYDELLEKLKRLETILNRLDY